MTRVTQVDDADLRCWGYSDEWRANDANDAEVFGIVLQVIERQRGDCIRLRNIHRQLLLKGINAHSTALRGLVLESSMDELGRPDVSILGPLVRHWFLGYFDTICTMGSSDFG